MWFSNVKSYDFFLKYHIKNADKRDENTLAIIIETEEISTPNLLKIDQQIAAIKDAIATIPAIAIGIIHFFLFFSFSLGTTTVCVCSPGVSNGQSI